MNRIAKKVIKLALFSGRLPLPARLVNKDASAY